MTYSEQVAARRRLMHDGGGFRRGQNTVTLTRAKRGLGPISNLVIIAAICCVLGLVYLTQVTRTNSLGYRVDALSTRQSELDKEQAALRLEASRLQSIETIKAAAAASNTVAVQPSAVAVAP